jgi:hypothetical protein
MTLTAKPASLWLSMMHGEVAMASKAANGAGRGHRWRIAGWGTAVALVLTPLIAMQFTREVNWTASDFLFAAILIGGVGAAYELAVSRAESAAYRAGAAFALAAAFLIVWANGAVGMIGSEGNLYNLYFYGVILIALVGAAFARFRPTGMAWAMAAAAVSQAMVSGGGLFSDPRGGLFSLAFAGLWLVSAGFFRKAARD